MNKIFFFFFTAIFAFCAEKSVAVDIGELNFEVVKQYKEQYRTINIKNLSIELASNTQIKNSKLLRLELSQNALKQSQGMFSAIYIDDGNKEQRLYFRYKLIADVEVVRAVRDIPRDKQIENSDIEFAQVSFDRTNFRNVLKDDIVGMNAKRFIRAGNSIGIDDISKPFLVVRNSSVLAAIAEDELEVEFEVTAMEDGVLGQVISVKNKNGKVYKGKVVAPSKVSIK